VSFHGSLRFHASLWTNVPQGKRLFFAAGAITFFANAQGIQLKQARKQNVRRLGTQLF